jgi:hypothetical protein
MPPIILTNCTSQQTHVHLYTHTSPHTLTKCEVCMNVSYTSSCNNQSYFTHSKVGCVSCVLPARHTALASQHCWPGPRAARAACIADGCTFITGCPAHIQRAGRHVPMILQASRLHVPHKSVHATSVCNLDCRSTRLPAPRMRSSIPSQKV